MTISLDVWRSDYGFDISSVIADPGFLGPDRHNYTVKDDSPALALGFKNIDQASIGLLADFPFLVD